MQASDAAPTTILVVLAHPFYEGSVAGRGLMAQTASHRRCRSHDLYEAYPDFAVNVRREQSLLLAHAVILLQFPMFWYSMPALLKEWIDVVFLAGFAYGPGARLAGKRLACAVTTGQGEEIYQPASGRGPVAGHPVGTVDELLLPLRATAGFCGMAWVPPFVVHGTLTKPVHGTLIEDRQGLPGDADLARYADWIEALARADAA